MVKDGFFTGLDIGTSSVKVLVAEYIDAQMNIIGVGNTKSEGIKNGVIVDIEKTVESIKKAVRQAEEKAGVQVTNVNVGLPANLLSVEECQGLMAVGMDNQEITDDNVNDVVKSALVRSVPPEREIVTVIPEEFIVDGFANISDPRGMIGVRLEMRGLMFTGPKTVIHNIKSTVKKAGLNIDQLVITPLALANSILTDGEKDFGTILLDMGGGQTTVAIMFDHKIKYTSVIKEGGEFVTKDISVVLNTSVKNAEGLKINYGEAYPAHASETEEFPVDVIGQNAPVRVNEKYLSEIIEARLTQIFDRVQNELEKIEALNLPGGIILTGGAATLPGVVDLATERFGINVKLFVPNQMGLRNPVFTNVISIVEHVALQSEIDSIAYAAVSGNYALKVAQTSQAPVSAYTEPVYQEDDYEDYHSETIERDTTREAIKDKGANIVERAKGFFNNIFD
ncbi:MAG: cell division protein FtsA [Streptococcaceae bacterium]|jgi:cell division protein FtsA|nr:cell division protein FtsA [Streptococcaceae bacterium]